MRTSIRLSSAVAVLTVAAGLACGEAGAQDALPPEMLRTAAAKLNEHTPLMVDAETELMSVGAEPRAIVYHYRLIGIDASDVSADKLRAAAEPVVARGACANSMTRGTFLDHGVAMRYVYHDKNRRLIASFDVTAAHCQAR